MEVKELTCAYAYHKLGTRCCAINAATLALVNAGIPMRDLVCACAAGCIDGTPLLDLNYVGRQCWWTRFASSPATKK